MVNSKDFAKRLEKILDFYGLTATAFSEEIDFNRSTISHLLSGRNKPSLEFVMKVLQKFPEVELYWLLNGKGEFPPKHPSENPQANPSDSPQKNLFESQAPEISIPEGLKRTNKENPLRKRVERIVLFYEDGTFTIYEN
jgi:transcriptional regulator with XRE-family HTH domain